MYVIHLVPNAPMQRIFYEIYRDRAAFDRHENQPYMQRFVADRRACVLATNVIELRVKYAKVAPLPTSPPAGPPGRRGRAAGPAPAGPAPAGPAPRHDGAGPSRVSPLPAPEPRAFAAAAAGPGGCRRATAVTAGHLTCHPGRPV